jgi:hypothetical protein
MFHPRAKGLEIFLIIYIILRNARFRRCLEEKLFQQESYPLLSCSNIEVCWAQFLPRRDSSVGGIVRQMEPGTRLARARSIQPIDDNDSPTQGKPRP